MNKKNLTEGSVWKKLIFFAIPLLASSFIQQMYNTVDLLYAGNMIGKQGTAAVGASSLVINCVVMFFTGLSVGTGVVVSHAIGAKDKIAVEKSMHTGMTLALLGGAVLMVAGISMAGTILHWMNTPDAIHPEATAYVRAYLFCIVPMFIYNMNSGAIRAMGDSRNPMIFQFIGGITNVVMDYFFIRLWGVVGIAWASTLSQGIPAMLSILYLNGRHCDYKLDWKKLGIDYGVFRQIIKIGLPAALQNVVIVLSNIFVQTQINHFGVEAIAAWASYFKIELLIYLPIVACGNAIMTFAGQNYGAGQFQRVKKGVRICLMIGCIYATLSGALCLLGGEALFQVFNPGKADVIACGLQIIKVTFPLYWLYVILEVLADASRGMGYSFAPMMIIMTTICGLRTLLLFILVPIFNSIESVAVTYPAAWFGAALGLALYWKFLTQKGMGSSSELKALQQKK